MNDKVEILGIGFDNVNSEDARKRIWNTINTDKNVKIFTPNPNMLLKAQNEPSLFEALRAAELLLPDGIGVILASKLLGRPLKEKITGIDTAEYILSEAAARGLSVFLLGGKKGVAKKAAENLCEIYPKLRVCGTYHGFFNKNGEENQKIIELIKNVSPDILFVCLGCPAQEIWIVQNAEKLPSVRIFAGLGGSIDVWSGGVKRAPRFMQKIGLEWLWRTAIEPRRLKNLTSIPIFLFKILRQKISSSTDNNEKERKTV